MTDMPKHPEQIRVTKRDLDLVKYQLELMRRASWTFPEASLQGQEVTFLRMFALDTYMNMRMLYPEAFKGKTVQAWEDGIRKFIMTRRPEFRGELLAKLRARYKGEAMDSDLLLAKSLEEMGKQGAKESDDKSSLFRRALHHPAAVVTAAAPSDGVLAANLYRAQKAARQHGININKWPDPVGGSLSPLVSMSSAAPILGLMAARHFIPRERMKKESSADITDIFMDELNKVAYARAQKIARKARRTLDH